MASNTDQPGNSSNTGSTPTASSNTTGVAVANAVGALPQQVVTSVEQNVKPVVEEAQRVAAQTSVSGRRAVSRGTILLIFYLWLLSGTAIFTFIARYTEFFPGDRTISRTLQKQHNPWFRRLMETVSAFGYPKISTPITIAISGIFLALRFRLEAIFVLLTSTSSLLSMAVKYTIKRPRPTNEQVTVVHVIDEPSFPSGHVMHYINFFGLLSYLLATNWRSGRLRNSLITVCVTLIALIGPSRIYLGAHWPSDVMVGYVYGGLWFAGLMSLYLRFKAMIHPAKGKTPEVMKPLQQPGDDEE
ncbi:MAG TPA: phosphatase PAP2 family protein [Ktedonobacteraceae bacterium]|nr:phosphatase PAP2 family protein [Ktedonobacteraceae bacterium]